MPLYIYFIGATVYALSLQRNGRLPLTHLERFPHQFQPLVFNGKHYNHLLSEPLGYPLSAFPALLLFWPLAFDLVRAAFTPLL